MYVRCSCYGGTLDFNTRYLLLPFLSVLAGGFFVFFFFVFFVFALFLFLYSRWSFVDVPLVFSCPANHVPDWQPRILLGISMAEAHPIG